jgi:dihydroorotase
MNDNLAPHPLLSSIDGKSSSVRQLECAILAGFPGNVSGEAFTNSIDILDRETIFLITFLLNFRSFVDNRIDFYAKTL